MKVGSLFSGVGGLDLGLERAGHEIVWQCEVEPYRRAIQRHIGTDFTVVRAVLRELGYGVAFRVLDSRYFGVPQRRRRVFIVGHLGARSADPFLPFLEGGQRHPETRSQARTDASAPATASTLGGRRGFSGDDIDRGGGFVEWPR